MFIYLLKATGPSALIPSHTVTVVCRRAFQTKEDAQEHADSFRATCMASRELTTVDNRLASINTLDIFPIHMRDDIGSTLPQSAKKVNPITELAYRVSKIFKELDTLDKATPGIPWAFKEKQQMYDISAMLYSVGMGDFKTAQKWLDSLSRIR